MVSSPLRNGSVVPTSGLRGPTICTDSRVGNGFGVFFLFFSTLRSTQPAWTRQSMSTAQRSSLLMFHHWAWLCQYLHKRLAECSIRRSPPIAFSTIGWKYYLVFIIVTLAGVPLVWIYFPETKGLSLEEISAAFGDKIAVDLTHMDSADRRALGGELAAVTAGELTVGSGSVAGHHSVTVDKLQSNTNEKSMA